MIELDCPKDTKGWVSTKVGEVEVFTRPNGDQLTRALASEQPEYVISFSRIPGLVPLGLVNENNSRALRRLRKKERRIAKERKQRGYD